MARKYYEEDPISPSPFDMFTNPEEQEPTYPNFPAYPDLPPEPDYGYVPPPSYDPPPAYGEIPTYQPGPFEPTPDPGGIQPDLPDPGYVLPGGPQPPENPYQEIDFLNPPSPPVYGYPIENTTPATPPSTPEQDLGVPPTSFNPPVYSSPPPSGPSGPEEPPLSERNEPSPPSSGTIFSQPRQNQPGPGVRPLTGSYRAYRPGLKVRNDAYLRGFGGDPAYKNTASTGYGGLRVGGFNDPGNPLLSPEEKAKRGNRTGTGQQFAGAFGLGLGG
jgi:hypothetical protein